MEHFIRSQTLSTPMFLALYHPLSAACVPKVCSLRPLVDVSILSCQKKHEIHARQMLMVSSSFFHVNRLLKPHSPITGIAKHLTPTFDHYYIFFLQLCVLHIANCYFI